jgi:2-keto-3-deoxy-galactonokinase
MPTFANWLGETPTADFDAASIIARDPYSLLLARGATDMAAQTVRIVPVGQRSTPMELRGRDDASSMGESAVIVIGDDTLNIARDDTFKYRDVVYKVVSVDKTMNGKIEALARGVQ